MGTKEETKAPREDMAIARAVFCWETEAYSGWVLHYYGDKDGNLISYPNPKEIESHKKRRINK